MNNSEHPQLAGEIQAKLKQVLEDSIADSEKLKESTEFEHFLEECKKYTINFI